MFEGQGYGFEGAIAAISYAKHTLNLNSILAITDERNHQSIKLLKKIGLRFKQSKELMKNDNVLVFTSEDNKVEKNKLDNLTQSFFEVFTNTKGKKPNLEKLKKLLIPNASIINNTKGSSEIYTIEEFIAPRKKILNNGTLTDFKEYEISNNTELFSAMANRFSLYKKQGSFNGKTFETFGKKSFQFIKIDNEWEISSVTWCDEVS